MTFDPNHHDDNIFKGGETWTPDDPMDDAGDAFQNVGENIRHGMEEAKENIRHNVTKIKNEAD